MTARSEHRLHAARVAATAAALVVALYLGCAVALRVFVSDRLLHTIDGRVAVQLAAAERAAATPSGLRVPVGVPGDPDDAPIFLWHVGTAGQVRPLVLGAPALGRHRWEPGFDTVTVAGTVFRTDAAHVAGGWIVAGQSRVEVGRVLSALVLPELLFGALLAAATFVGALLVGLRASAPLDVIRRRQAEFTADASHELRTPLSVVEAEVGLALQRTRTPEEYQAVLRRIAGEGARLHRIVEDLLWLARAEGGAPADPATFRADVAEVAAGCTRRFEAVARRDHLSLAYRATAAGAAWVAAPPEWVDRLVGVLVDNACKYAGPGGTVEVTVVATGNRVSLAVDDSGPGIPPEERPAVFDRFRRASEEGSGSGLGLAIADSVVRGTGGSWHMGDSRLGGARMEVSWRRQNERNPSQGSGTSQPAGSGDDHASSPRHPASIT